MSDRAASASCCSPTARATRAGPRRSRRSPRACARARPALRGARCLPRADGAGPRRRGRGAGRRGLHARRRRAAVPRHRRPRAASDLPPLVAASCAARASAASRCALHAAIGEACRDVIAGDGRRPRSRGIELTTTASDMNLHQFRFVQEAVRRNLNLTETAKALLHLAARRLQGHPRARGRARRRHLRAPRQAPAPRHRAGPAGAEVDRDHHARGRQPEAHRRGVLQAGRRHAVDRHHAHARRATSCPSRWRSCASAIPKVQRQPAPGHARAGGAHAARRASPTSAWRPSRWPTSTTWSPCPATSGSTCWCCRPAHPLAAVERLDARAARRRAAGHLPPVVHRPHAHRRRRSRARSCKPERRARGDRLRRDQDLRAARAWAWASSPRWRCATTRRAATWCRGRSATCSASNVTRVAFKRGAYLRNFVYAFAELLSDRLTRALIAARDGRRRRGLRRRALRPLTDRRSPAP